MIKESCWHLLPLLHISMDIYIYIFRFGGMRTVVVILREKNNEKKINIACIETNLTSI